MKKYNIQFLLILTLVVSLSCERQSAIEEQAPNPDPESPKIKKLVPLEMKSSTLTLKFEYKPGTGLLTKVSQSDSKYVLITYAPKYYRVAHYQNNTLYHYSDFLTADGIASRVHSFDSFGNVDVPTGHSNFEYSNSGQLVGIKYYNVSNTMMKEVEIAYSTLGNILTLTTNEHSDKRSRYEFTSDDKNSIFKHVDFARLLFLEMPYDFFCPDARNWLTRRDTADPKKDISYSYQYNNEGYPSRMTIEASGRQEKFDISYKDSEE